jgi:NADH-ubiquinone oxidoreductase chain 5
MFWLLEIGFVFFISVGLLCLYFSYITIIGGETYLLEWVFFRLFGLDLGAVFLFDWIRLIFSGIVLIISGCVFYYIVGYIEGDKTIVRFGLLVMLFIVSMLFVIFCPRFIRILLGWDGLGLVSYCLVIYYGNFRSYNAGIITGIRNRIGDVGLLLAVGLLFRYGGWNFYLMDRFGDYFTWICLCVVLAGFTRRAQIPFSAWLPAAMAAPTPVSALVHSSTLVTAGVYLLVRFYSVIRGVWWLVLFVLYGGALTIFIAGLRASFESDVKKIIALSTLRQLGVIIVAVGVGLVYLAFFHLVCHAVFRALLFLGGGRVIHRFGGRQDVRFMGGVIMGLPVRCVRLNVANFSLCGLPFITGFYSRDLILECFGLFRFNFLCLFAVFFGTIFTVIYSVRFCWFRIISYYGGGGFEWSDLRAYYTIPIRILSFGGVVCGSLFFWFGVPIQDLSYVFGLYRFWPGALVFLRIVFSSIYLFTIFRKIGGHDFFWRMWFIPLLRVETARYPFFGGGRYLDLVDLGWGEGFGGQGVWRRGRLLRNIFYRVQGVVFGIIVTILVFWFVFLFTIMI